MLGALCRDCRARRTVAPAIHHEKNGEGACLGIRLFAYRARSDLAILGSAPGPALTGSLVCIPSATKRFRNTLATKQSVEAMSAGYRRRGMTRGHVRNGESFAPFNFSSRRHPDAERSQAEGPALKILPHLPPSTALSSRPERRDEGKDPRVYFHGFGWNTLTFPTAVVFSLFPHRRSYDHNPRLLLATASKISR